METKYLFKSKRLGFRKWSLDDLDFFHEINSNEQVMQFFPSILSRDETEEFILRMIKMQDEHACCYFPVELLENGVCIGFIGIAYQDYESFYNPSYDIGWRIHPDYWGSGYATEGATACLRHGKEILQLKKIVAVAPEANLGSIRVMEKIGMNEIEKFIHPKLLNHIKLANCVLFEKRF